jgi:hypothetical protein
MGDAPDIRLVFVVIETAPGYFARFIFCTASLLSSCASGRFIVRTSALQRPLCEANEADFLNLMWPIFRTQKARQPQITGLFERRSGAVLSM